MRVAFRKISEAFDFASLGNEGESRAYLCKQTGETDLHFDHSDLNEELPEDIDDEDKYIQLPGKKELGLGKPLALKFASQFLPDDYHKVRDIFSRRGAYARFKDLLEHRRAVQQWYDFEAKSQEEALREWCELNSIEVTEDADDPPRRASDLAPGGKKPP
jgi:hypothetical protein